METLSLTASLIRCFMSEVYGAGATGMDYWNALLSIGFGGHC